MKRETFIKTLLLAWFAGFFFFVGLQTAQAQSGDIYPFVDCVEREYDQSGAATGNYIAYFGYSSRLTATRYFRATGSSNYFSGTENRTVQNKFERFAPGVHPRVVSVKVPIGEVIGWVLNTDEAVAFFPEGNGGNSNLCSADGANSRLITYQGKLSDGAAAANGAYDLQFQVFNAESGGAAQTSLINVEDVPVTNGIFIVRLDLGANALADGNPAGNLKLNPAILDAQNTYFEISVRAGTSTGAYTVLIPRQPINAVPLAMRANTANVAFRAAFADRAANADNATNADKLGNTAANLFVKTDDSRLSNERTPIAGSANYIQNTTAQQANSNFNISGGGTVGGTLTANTVSANSLNITNGGAIGGNLTVSGTTERLLDVQGSSNTGTWLTLDNTTTGGRRWSLVSTGANNGEGAGKLLFFDLTSATRRFQLSSDGASVNGNLTVSGTVSGNIANVCRAGFTAVANGRLCISEMQPSNSFYNAAQVCTNLGARVGNSADVALSFTLSGFNYFAGSPGGEPTPKGWLADIINDGVRATWNAVSPNQDFDGTPLNVITGGGGGTAPQLLYRCVY